jgi:small subunit ribosomal protein S4
LTKVPLSVNLSHYQKNHRRGISVTRIIRAKGKISRRLRCNLWGQKKNPFDKRQSSPGPHGARGYKKLSTWGKQLHATQKFRFYYHMTEKQMRKAYTEAIRIRGDSGENFVGLLERRLDIVVYRLNFAPSIFTAGQLVSHKHILVNGRKVNIRSYLVRPGDIIELTDKAKAMAIVMGSIQAKERRIPEYIEVSEKDGRGKFLRIPNFAEIPYAAIMEPSLVIARYSR